MLVSLVLNDAGTRASSTWLRKASPSIVLSDFAWGELIATLGREVRARKLSQTDATALAAAARLQFVGAAVLPTTADDIVSATEFVGRFHLGLRLPDAIHLAIAQRHGATLVTTDERQADAAAALGIGYVDPTRPA